MTEDWVEKCPECGRTWDRRRDDRECWDCEVPTIEKGQDKITEWSE